MTYAIILAAGKGSRLYPLSKNKPKCLTKLFGISLLEHQINNFKKKKLNKIILGTGYSSESFNEFSIKKIKNKFYRSTNMVFTLFNTLEHTRKKNKYENEDLIVSYGDIVYQENILSELIDSNSPITVIVDESWLDLWKLRFQDPLIDAETLVLNKKNYIVEIGKKIKNLKSVMGQYIGLIKIRSDYVDKIINFYDSIDINKMYDGKSFKQMYMTTFIQLLVDHKFPVKAKLINGGWLEVDTINDINLYENLEKTASINKFYKS